MVLYGGVALAVVAGLACIRLAGLPPWEASDALVLAWTPCLALVRLGCFLNGCCYGEPTTSPLGLVAGGAPNAVNFGIPSHPAQLYDAAALLAIWGVLRGLRTRRVFPGALTLTFLTVYALFRVFHETLRGDTRPVWALASVPLTFNQLVSVALFAVAVTAGVVVRRRFAIRVPASA
jgi:phosphatidylglycerol:prolipoprotein diacylglycerol transferase